MSMKKGQGMSFNTIVKIILAVLVLTTIVIFFTGGIKKLSSSFAQTSAGATSTAQITSVRTQCTQYCMSLDHILASADDAVEQPYCTTSFKIVEDGDPDDIDYCYDSIITGGTECEVTLSTGQRVTIDRSECMGGALGQVGRVTNP